MSKLTSRERVARALERQPVDQIPVSESIWESTMKRWRGEGHLGEEEDPISHFDIDFRAAGWLNSTADLDFEVEVLEETEETILRKDGNLAVLRAHKLHESTPEHVDFTVKDRAGWEEHIKPHLVKTDRRRINFEGYRETKAKAAEEERFFNWSGVAPFEQMHPMCGHEYMLMGMALDPDWVRDMAMTYAEMTLRHLEILFAEEGPPEGFFFYEDMGFKERPFMSPEMYGEIMQPAHAKLFDYAHSLGCKVIVHSCGYVETLVPGLVEAGLDCLQSMEVKAGMDMRRLAKDFGDRLSFFGNIDARVLLTNDREIINRELEEKIRPMLEQGCGYLLHSDHSIPPEVDHDTLHYFFDRGREISREYATAGA